jgi:predicted O-methyltransferase YrrM
MVITLLVIIVVLLSAAVVLGVNVARYRAARFQRGIFRPWPIPKVRVQEFDPRFTADEFGATTAAEVAFIGVGNIAVSGATNDFESWILAAMAKGASTMFEFGTCTGRTTYLWARNQPPNGRVITLTLAPDQLNAYKHETGDSEKDARFARTESQFTRFRYSGTDVERRIVQLYGDSKEFDETPYVDACDVVFVDGSHAYSYVVSDSQKALRMVKPGGVVLWHDYKGSHRTPGVFRALNELVRRLPLRHLAGTSLVVYRRPLT